MPRCPARHHTEEMTQSVAPSGPGVRPVVPSQLAWLEKELDAWRSAGLVDDVAADAIRSRYVVVRRFSLTRLLLLVGGAFIGVGLLWLVASNLDTLSPMLRFAVVTALWLGFVALAEVLAQRRARHGLDGEPRSGPVVGTFRLIAALSFGAVVFQAAQSLQVPAFEPTLVGVWGVGALLYAYAVDGVAPLLVGIVAGTSWYVWEILAVAEDGMGFVLPVLLAAAVAGAVAVVHTGRRLTAFATSWREASALLALLGLFVAAFPYVDLEEFAWSVPVVAGIVVAVFAVAGSVVLTSGRARLEAVVPLAAAGIGVLLVLWEPPEMVGGTIDGEGYAHASVSVMVYLLAAGWYAVLGILRDSPRLAALATGSLVLFTTVQSFAVFAPIITGATMFLVLGVILVGSGFLFDRGRRRLVASLEGATA